MSGALALGSLAYGLNEIDTTRFWTSLTSVDVLRGWRCQSWPGPP